MDLQLHLVDGTYELFRAFYGPNGSAQAHGREVGATRGLLRSLLALLREPGVTHVGVAFDRVIESFRNELWAGYKTSEGIDPALYAQFELAERAVAALGVVVWPMVEFEADDALATFAKRGAESVEVARVVICSPDKDLCQCVQGERVVCLDRMRARVIDEPGVMERLGVPPASVPDYLALVGDSADGIPGIARWGAKSTATVLQRYAHLESIPGDVADWDVTVRGGATLAENLRTNLDSAKLYRTLATLRTDVPLTQTINDLKWRGPDLPAIAAMADELQDRKLVELTQRAWEQHT